MPTATLQAPLSAPPTSAPLAKKQIQEETSEQTPEKWGPPEQRQYSYHHSGINAWKHFRMLEAVGGSGMVNVRCVHQPRVRQGIEEHPGVRLVLDSGAFQGETDVEGYAKKLLELEARHPGRFEWAANLDVIGDQGASNENYSALTSLLRRARSRGREAPKVLWVYQAGEASPQHIRFMQVEHGFEAGSLVGVGGLVPLMKAGKEVLFPVLERIGRTLERCALRAHFFGVGAKPVLSAFGGEPWFASADSQKWTAGLKGRKLYREDGGSIRASKTGLKLTPRECALQNLRQIEGWLSQARKRTANTRPLGQEGPFHQLAIGPGRAEAWMQAERAPVESAPVGGTPVGTTGWLRLRLFGLDRMRCLMEAEYGPGALAVRGVAHPPEGAVEGAWTVERQAPSDSGVGETLTGEVLTGGTLQHQALPDRAWEGQAWEGLKRLLGHVTGASEVVDRAP